MVAVPRAAEQRVLYVDDDPVSRRIFEQLGRTAEIAVDVCGSLDEAFAFARQRLYSVIAADYSLRRWDGLSVLRELNGLQSSASLMLVTDADRRSALPSSLLNYVFVEKPIQRAKVLSQLSEALSAYEGRARAPHAALLAAPVLLLSSHAGTAGHLSRGLAELGAGRVRVSRALDVAQAFNMLNAVAFSAVLIDPYNQPEGSEGLVAVLRLRAPELPVVLVSDQAELTPLMDRPQALLQVKRDVSAELLLHTLCRAVEREALEREIHALRYNDITTGARNRPTFCARLAQRAEQATPFVLTCFTVAGIGGINQTLGHLRGDAVLAASTARLQRELGERAVIGRLGGSTFAVLSDANDDDARAAVERAVCRVFELPFDLSDTQVRVHAHSVSREFPKDGTKIEELLSSAERALQEYKGR